MSKINVIPKNVCTDSIVARTCFLKVQIHADTGDILVVDKVGSRQFDVSLGALI